MKNWKYKRFLTLPFSLAAIAGLVWVLSSMAERRRHVPESKARAEEHKWAVIIGINDYKDPQILDLRHAVADAQGVYELLAHEQYGGFEAEKVRLLMDESETKPTRNNILKALTSIENVADENDTIFVSFSGHGIEESGVSYFLPSDTDISILRDTGIPMERFIDTLDRTKAKVQVMFFDACHSGARMDKSGSGSLSQNTLSRVFTEAEGRVILSSCKAGEVSWELPEEGHGVFTYYLMDALKGQADFNDDGFVTVSEASNYVTEQVKEWAFRTGRKQNPRLMYNVTGEIVLSVSAKTPLPTTEHPGTEIGKDDAPMVLIPAGEFQMGSNDGEDDEKPVHTVYLDAFYIDVCEVTNAQYKKFKTSPYWNIPEYRAPDQPVVGVSWYDARNYCEWVGKRLPTEAEWEKAARGGLVGKKYPCGNSLTHNDANYYGTDGRDAWTETSPVGSFAPNGYGLYDMAGNVWEWCADLYDSGYYAISPRRNPTGPSSGKDRVLRGGSCNSVIHDLRVAFRGYFAPPLMPSGIGFRCAKDVEP